MSTTRISRHFEAPRDKVYRALLDADAIGQWRVPTGMTSEIHVFEAHVARQARGVRRVQRAWERPSR